jgi:hypothetical protein
MIYFALKPLKTVGTVGGRERSETGTGTRTRTEGKGARQESELLV